MKMVINSTGVVLQTPILAFGGVTEFAKRMSNTENFLVNKNIREASTLSSALNLLHNETVPSPMPEGKESYRKSLVTAFFYKFILSLQETLPSYLLSATQTFKRPVSSGTQTFGTDPSEYPVSQPIPKLEAKIQSTGEARYTDDTPNVQGTLFAALVTSTIARGTLHSVDVSPALSIPGVEHVFTSKDISPSRNKWGVEVQDEFVFAESEIGYYGQPIAIVLATSQSLAIEASKAVRVNYTNVQTPILSIQDAIQANSFYNAPLPSLTAGNVSDGFSKSAKVIEGVYEQGSQFHFYMEQQSCYVLPEEGNTLKVIGSLQSSRQVQKWVAQVCGLPFHSVKVETLRAGDTFSFSIVCQLDSNQNTPKIKRRRIRWERKQKLGCFQRSRLCSTQAPEAREDEDGPGLQHDFNR